MRAFSAEKFELLERCVSAVVRVASITNLKLSPSYSKAIYDDKYLKVLVYH
jgi:hypothetical protein